MGIKFISYLCMILLWSCHSPTANFKLSTQMKSVNFKCLCDWDNKDGPLFENYIDTTITFEIINIDKQDLFFFHDRTFTIPYYKPYTSHLPRENNTIIKYFNRNKNEIFGRFGSVSLDSSNVSPDYFIPTIMDTMTYKITEQDTFAINQRLNLPYSKDLLLITLTYNRCKEVKFIKFCLSQGRKKKNKLYGIECTDFIEVIHK